MPFRNIFRPIAVVAAPLLAVAAAVAGPIPAADAAYDNGISLVSVATPEDPAYNGSSPSAISDGGRYVAFTSQQPHLTSTTVDNHIHVYVRNVDAGTTTMIGWAKADDAYANPVLSKDGSVVAYGTVSSGRTVIRLADTTTGKITTTIQTPNFGPNYATYSSYQLAFAAGGRFLVFSQTSLLLDGTNGTTTRLFRYDLQTQQTTQLVAADLGFSVLEGYEIPAPAVSADGRYVTYYEQNGEPAYDRLYRSVLLDTTTGKRITVATGTLLSAGDWLSLSRDGNLLAYSGDHGIAGTAAPVYVYNRTTGTRTTLAAAGAQVAISGNGRYVVYEATSTAPPTNPNSAQGSMIYRYDRTTGQTVALVVNRLGNPPGGEALIANPHIDLTGSAVAFGSNWRTLTRDTGLSPLVNGRAFVWRDPAV